MAELEIHHEGHESDPLGKRVGVLAAILAVVLALVTIASHRAHTEGVLLKTDANDRWSQYQSKRLKYHNLELGEDLLTALGSANSRAEAVATRYRAEEKRYDREAKETQAQAKEIEHDADVVERQALRYDFGEGLLEIGLVLSSLYFIARRRLFPTVGALAGVVGAAVAATGLMIR